ncbi:hypothetical protein JTE90_020410 [Oedothorax gibbosus]|uniref:Sodium-dependent multivitamin transporter n=1 Tax=Oedothorax gibbosus TaxID=931172 RepID=A0AAV6UE47_9ARAC|nr:hypothetical protein JTE90_020410 [Oedothorax gibbosus]
MKEKDQVILSRDVIFREELAVPDGEVSKPSGEISSLTLKYQDPSNTSEEEDPLNEAEYDTTNDAAEVDTNQGMVQSVQGRQRRKPEYLKDYVFMAEVPDTHLAAVNSEDAEKTTTDEYLLAGRDMPILPVAFSLMASFQSAITTIGIPAEVYRFGMHITYLVIGYASGMVIAALLTVPVYFQLQASSAYEYLDRRYGKYARTFTSAAFVIQMILYMAVVLYAPALALSAVTNMPMWVAIVSIGVVCTFYCTLGGMKAVLWTDLFQGVLMFVGLLATMIKGVMDIGLKKTYETAYEGGRLDFPSLEVDPTVRYTIWGTLCQGLVLAMISYAGSQIQIQRLLTVKNLKRAQLAVYLNIPMACFFHILACGSGVIIYSYYATCDPITSGRLSSSDQLMPYFMMSTLGEYPGLPGLCICGVFSASLSTVSSAVNSLTAVTMQDFIRPILEAKGSSQKHMVRGAMVLTLFYGMLGVGLSFAVAAFGNLAQAGLTVYGMMGAPVLGILILGMVTTRANEKGAIIGLVSGIALAAWIGFGATSQGAPAKWLPVTTVGCTYNNSTINGTVESSVALVQPSINVTSAVGKDDDIFILYRISFMWFSTIGVVTTIVVGYLSSLVVSIFTGPDEEVKDELLSPLVKCCWKKKKTISMDMEIVNGTSIVPEKKPELIHRVPDIMEQNRKNADLEMNEKTISNGEPKHSSEIPEETKETQTCVRDLESSTSDIMHTERL